jgi:N-methylhydantoinase A/oxoprolinase/acetone carboxylase beta subunit
MAASSDWASIGVDVGGTNSDAVVLRNAKDVVSWAKVATTSNITDGVEKVVKMAINKMGAGNAASLNIRHISIGNMAACVTLITKCVNELIIRHHALLECRDSTS